MEFMAKGEEDIRCSLPLLGGIVYGGYLKEKGFGRMTPMRSMTGARHSNASKGYQYFKLSPLFLSYI